MTAAATDPAPSDRHRLANELYEDLDVAVREFLERNPQTGSTAIRMAFRLAERRTRGGTIRNAARVLELLAVFVFGLALGLWLG